jgi:uncharacterized protein
MSNPCFSSPKPQRVGEIILIGPPGTDKESFIRAICPHVTLTTQDIILGRLDVSSELVLYFYGIGFHPELGNVAWDLLAKKMLGYIVLFNWFDETSFVNCKTIVDFTTTQFEAPFVVAANVGEQPLPYGEKMRRPEILLSNHARFLFCQSHKPVHARKIVLSLFDLLLEHCSV